jgi:hypothetical protein
MCDGGHSLLLVPVACPIEAQEKPSSLSPIHRSVYRRVQVIANADQLGKLFGINLSYLPAWLVPRHAPPRGRQEAGLRDGAGRIW